MKRLLILFLALSLALSSAAVYADAKDDKIAELEARIEVLERIVADLQARLDQLEGPTIAGTRSLTLAEDVTYILNTKSHKIHKIDGADTDTIAEQNRMETNLSLEELQAQGYTTCGNCFSR